MRERTGRREPVAKRNHPMVRVSQTAPSMLPSAIRLDVGAESIFLTAAEALAIHQDLDSILRTQGFLA